MKDNRDNKVVPFPARLLTGALVLTGVMLVAMAWSGVDSYRNIATVRLHDLRIQELRGAIVHLDEVLTMSARMAAATGDSDWERRYRQFEPQLDAAIKEAMELTAHSASAEAAAQTDAANLKLVEMENQSFALVLAGEAARAKAILFSDTYAAQKKIYAEGMGQLIQHLKEQLTANQRKKQREAVLSIIVVAICIVLLFSTWLSILRRLNSWRTTQAASVNALTRADEELRQLNNGLEDRTRSLQLEILERKEAEGALRDSGETFRQFAENITDVFWIRSPDMREVHYVSPAFERIWGRSVESLYANPPQWADFILPEDRERVLGVFAALAAGETPSLEVEYRIVRPDGEVRWVHARGFQVRNAANEVIRLTGIVTDITERKRAEGELHWKTAFLEAQVNSSIDGILVVDQEGKKSLQNQRFVDLFRIPQDIADEPCDENRLRWVTSRTKDPEQFIKSVLYLYAHPNEIGRDEIELKDGTILDRYSSPVVGKDGKYYGRIWTFRDITERKLAEDAMRESEERFSGAFEHAPIGVALVSRGGRWLRVNRAVCALVGYSEAELLKRTFQDITHPEDLETDLENVRRMLAGEIRSYQMEKRYIHARGHFVTVLLNVSLIRDGEGQPRYFISQIQDITERKLADQALRESEERFRLLAKATNDAIWDWNLATNALWWNEGFEKLFGYRRETVDPTAKSWTDNIHPEDLIRVTDGIHHVIEHGGEGWTDEYRFRCQDGSYSHVLDRGHIIRDGAGKGVRMIGGMQDITGRKGIEESLRASQANMAAAQRIAHFGSWELELSDSNDIHANALRWSDEMYRIAGYEPGAVEISHEFFFRLAHPDDRESIRQTMATAIRERRPYFIVHRLIRPDGEARVVQEEAQIFFDERTGRPLRIVGTAHDITERKLSEAALEKAHQELVQASRQAGMAEAATGVLHNVGNVLNSVNVASSCLADSLRKSKAANLSKVVAMLREHESDLGVFLTSDPKGKQVPAYLGQLAEHLAGEQAVALKELAQLQKNIEHIKEVVTEQQRCAKGAGKSETLQVTDLVEDTLRMDSGGQASRDIQVITEFEYAPLITVDKHKVMQILMNLVRNAKQACHEGGSLDKRLTLRVTNGDERVRVAVSDNGVGISAENQARIFTHGFTTKKDGHGFGLHSAMAAAKEMGGGLRVHSDGVGQGATFTLDLPLRTSTQSPYSAPNPMPE